MKLEEFCKIFCLIFLFSLSINGFSQKKSDLEEQKRKNLEMIRLSRELLETTREKTEGTVHQVNLLNKRIEYRNQLLANYQEEIHNIEIEQGYTENSIQENKLILNELKEKYAKIIRTLYRNIEDEYVLMYILSSEDINQAYERIRYLKYINDYRAKLYADIDRKNDSLIILNRQLDSLAKEMQLSIETLKEENENLYKDKRQFSISVSRLKGKEQEIVSEIREREENQRKIENEIRRIIEEEARKAREANRVYELTPEERIISDDFIQNKGGLPWPAIQGVVTGEFGEHPHPVIPGITVSSNGIDLSTLENSEVKAIFKGEVTVVSAILGANYTVIIKHGNYRSVYQNLINVRVKSGDFVEINEIIAKVGTNMDNETKLHFELWEGMNVVNPKIWLSK